MVFRIEVEVNGGSVNALARDASLYNDDGSLITQQEADARRKRVIEGSRVVSVKRPYQKVDIELAWDPMSNVEPPRDIVEARAVAALLLAMRTVRS